MADSRPSYEVLPFAPGASPFHVKGLAYRGHLDYVEAYLPGGAKGCRDAFHDPALREFFDQHFLASSWYDVYPLVAAGHVCARIANLTFDGFLRIRARYQAEQDIHGVYKIFAQLASAEALVKRLDRMSASYFDFGSSDVRQLGPRHIEGTRTGVPAAIVPWTAPILTTFIDYALMVNGAKHRKLVQRPSKKDGVAHGIETMTIGIEVSWE